MELIWAGSPQAKGRVERKNGVLQDRLVKALRLAEAGPICGIEAANLYLEEVFLPGFNERFCVEASGEADLHTRVSEEELDAALVVRDVRVVGRDGCVGHEGRVLQLKPGRRLTSLSGKRVQVERDLAGEVRVVWRGEAVEHEVLEARPVRERKKRERRVKEHYKPPSSHPWRRAAV